jgi:hypothetical protein
MGEKFKLSPRERAHNLQVPAENYDKNISAPKTESYVWYENFAVCSFIICTLH